MVTGCLPSIDVKNFSSDEIRRVEIQYCIHNYFSHATYRLERGKERMGFAVMHGGFDDPRRDGIHSHAIFGMFYGQGFRRGVQRTLGERCEDARHAVHGLVNQAGRDSYDMTTPRLAHHLYRALGHMKETCDITAVLAGESPANRDAMGRAARIMAPSLLQRINGAPHAKAERFEQIPCNS